MTNEPEFPSVPRMIDDLNNKLSGDVSNEDLDRLRGQFGGVVNKMGYASEAEGIFRIMALMLVKTKGGDGPKT